MFLTQETVKLHHGKAQEKCRKALSKEKEEMQRPQISWRIFQQIQSADIKELRLLIKTDVQGTAEAVKQQLEKLSNEEVKVVAIHTGVGAISESDINLAAASNAIVIGFSVRPDAIAKKAAEREKVISEPTAHLRCR